MKRSILTTTAFLISLVVGAQVLTVNEGFETWPAPNWDDYTIGAGNGWGQDFDATYHTGAHSAHSYINNSQCDNWLVSPQVSVTTNSYQLTFWELNDDPEYLDNRTVHISTGSGNPADGDFVEALTFVDTPTVWTERTLDLSSYQGQDIYVAFRYEGTWHKWYVDDVSIEPTSFVDGAITSVVNPTGVGEIGTENVQVEVTNNGTGILDNVDIAWSVNGNTQTPYVTTNLNLAIGASTIIDLGTYDFNAFGQYDITATLTTAGDFVPTNNTITSTYGITTIKDAALVGINPEAMTPITGLQDVSIIIENVGQYQIDTASVSWSVDGTAQTVFNTETLGLAPGQTTEVTIGQYNFGTGVYEIGATIAALGDTTSFNDSYLAYAAVDTFWESFEGRIFPPENWSLDFGVLDNISFDIPPHGNFYYSSMVDDNFFGYVSDTLYTPVLDIQQGDVFSFRLKTSGFLAADLELVYKDEATGAVTVLQTITNPQWESWLPQNINISAATGTNRIGIVTTPTGSYGTAKFDLFTSTASLHFDDNDLAITQGDMYFLARVGQSTGFDCTIRNLGNLPVNGNDYTIRLMEEPGVQLASASGVSLDPFEDAVITVNHTFNGIDAHRLYFEIDYAQDQNLNNNSFRSTEVSVVPNTVVIDAVGEIGMPNPGIPFDGGGNTNTLGQNDLSQTHYTAGDIPTVGNVYGMIYSYNTLVAADEVKYLPLKVWVSQTGVADLSGGWIPQNELTLVYDDTLEILPGNEHEVYIPFDEPVMYSGLSNLVFQDFQYDPSWPPSVVRFYDTDLPNSQSIRTIGVLDYYQLEAGDQPVDFFSYTGMAYTQFVIDPITLTSEVSGTVYNSTTNLPLDGATVSVDGAGLSVTSDVNGNYTLPSLPYGNYSLTASLLGYNDSTVSVTLNAATQTQDMYLEERAQVELLMMVVGSNAPSVPLEDVQVSAVGYTTDGGATNASGNLNLTNIFGVSDYAVSFSLYGYYDTTITVSVIDQNIDLGTVVLEQEFISPFDVHIALGGEPIVKWKDPLKSDKVKMQNDFGFNSHSYTNEPFENVFLGNYFPITDTTTITSVEFLTDIYVNAIDTVTIEIYDFNYDTVCVSKPFLIYPDSLHVIDVPNVVVYDSVFAMIHWQNNAASTNALVVDFSDPSIPNTAVIGYPGQQIVSLNDFLGGGPSMSFLLRLHTLDDGNNATNNEALTYNVYRGLSNEFPSLDNWQMLNSTPLTTVSYPDVDWGSVDENQNYRYAVETIYTDGTSEVTFSNVIDGSWVGIEDLIDIAAGVSVYPVPSNGQITVSIDEVMKVEGAITLTDIQGKEILRLARKAISSNQFSIDLGQFQSGVYHLKMVLNGKLVSKRIVLAGH